MSKSIISNKGNEKISQKGIPKELIFQILGQQQQYRKQQNKQSLLNLIALYRKMVEHYSQRNDFIYLYFSQKMQQMSTNISLLQQQQEKLTMSMARQSFQQDMNPIDPRFKTVITTPIKYDPQIKKKQRSKNAQIAIEVSKIKKRANARTILKSYYDQCLENNLLITQDLQNQRKQLQEKLMMIHQRSIQRGSQKIVL